MPTRRDRKLITLPDGRVISGFLPPDITPGNATPEHKMRDHLARQLGGVIEARLGLGSQADVLTDGTVFEVKHHSQWTAGVRQAAAYSALSLLPPALALFGLITRDSMLAVHDGVRKVRFPGLRASAQLPLWWYTGKTWAKITTAADCSDMPHGAQFSRCTYCQQQIARLPGDDPRCSWQEFDGNGIRLMPHGYDCEPFHLEHHVQPVERCLRCAVTAACPA